MQIQQENQKDLNKIWDKAKRLWQRQPKQLEQVGFMIIEYKDKYRKDNGQIVDQKLVAGEIREQFKSLRYTPSFKISYKPQSGLEYISKQNILKMIKMFMKQNFDQYIIYFVGHTNKHNLDFSLVDQERNHEFLDFREVLQCLESCQPQCYKHFLIFYQCCYMGNAINILKNQYSHLTNVDLITASNENIYNNISGKSFYFSNFMTDVFGIKQIQGFSNLADPEILKRFIEYLSQKIPGSLQSIKYEPLSDIHHKDIINRFPAFFNKKMDQNKNQQVLTSYNYLKNILNSQKQKKKFTKEQLQKLFEKRDEMARQQIDRNNQGYTYKDNRRGGIPVNIMFCSKIQQYLENNKNPGIILFMSERCYLMYQGFFRLTKKGQYYWVTFDGFGKLYFLYRDKNGIFHEREHVGEFSKKGRITGWRSFRYKTCKTKNEKPINLLSLTNSKYDGGIQSNQIAVSYYRNQYYNKLQILLKSKQSPMIKILIDQNRDRVYTNSKEQNTFFQNIKELNDIQKQSPKWIKWKVSLKKDKTNCTITVEEISGQMQNNVKQKELLLKFQQRSTCLKRILHRFGQFFNSKDVSYVFYVLFTQSRKYYYGSKTINSVRKSLVWERFEEEESESEEEESESEEEDSESEEEDSESEEEDSESEEEDSESEEEESESEEGEGESEEEEGEPEEEESESEEEEGEPEEEESESEEQDYSENGIRDLLVKVPKLQ